MFGVISRSVLKFLLNLLGFFVAPLCRLTCGWSSKKCPPIQNPLLLHSATQLVQMIKSRQVTSEQVVSAYIARCRVVNPVLNAIVDQRFGKALEEARAVDSLVEMDADTSDKPLLGVPITIKESLAVEGLSNAAGCVRYSGVPAPRDAEAVRRVRAAGAIPILVSNTPELCMSWETYNNITGRTSNPYDTRRTCGGSSGGEAALISSGASMFGLASDIGGSLRLPALFTGIFGHKPTPGVISNEGHRPGCVNKDWYKYFTLGPMARYAEDLPLLLGVVADPSGPQLTLDKKVDIKDIKVYYMENDSDSRITNSIDSEIVAAMRTAVKYLKNVHGIEAQKINIKEFEHSFEVPTAIMARINGIDNIFMREDSSPEQMHGIKRELLKKIFCMSQSIFYAIAYGLLNRIANALSADRMAKYEEVNRNIQKQFESLLGDNGVFLYPTFPAPAHFHNQLLYKLFNVSYMLIFNTLGMPVTQCPLGLNKRGLPIGIQIAANPCQDHLTFAVAKEFETAFGGWIPPPSSVQNINVI